MFRNLKNKIEDKNSFIYFFIFFAFIFSILIIWRLYFLQIEKGAEYRKIVLESKKKHQSDLIFERGKIFFMNKEQPVLAAFQKEKTDIYIDNYKNRFFKMKNLDKIYKKISQVLNIDAKKIILKNKKSAYIVLKRGVDENTKRKIISLKIKNLKTKPATTRFHPMGDLGSEILGILNYNHRGISGLEKKYDEILKRNFKQKKEGYFGDIFFKPFKDFFKKKLIQRKANLITNIDASVQSFLEKKIFEINEKYHSKKTLGIIMKSATGEIIAMASTEKKTGLDNFSITQSRYEPGSIIKPLIVSLALETGAINENFSYNDTGCLFVGEDKICNYDKRARGANTNLVKVIAQSLNVGMVRIEERVKKDNFLRYFLNFGLAEETGIDLPDEISQNISSLNYKIPINYATAAFGQGVAFTPIATLRALNIIASDGFLVQPHIVKKIEYDNPGISDDIIEIQKKRVLSLETIDKIQRIMIKAVEITPSKMRLKPKYFSVGAKTGTAQIAGKNGGYKKGVNIHTFFGFFPAKAKPEDRYSIILYTFEPRAKYSSQTLTKPFFDIMKFLINYYDIKPDLIK